MKRLALSLIAILIAFTLPAYATQKTATFGDKNSSNIYRVASYEDSSNGSNLGWIVYAPDTGIYYPYLYTATTNTTLVASQTGTTLVFNNGSGVAASGTQFTLPAATAGMQFTLIADVAKWMYVKPASGEIINFSTCSANSRINNSSTAAIGDSVTLFSATTGEWSIKNKVGTWACGA